VDDRRARRAGSAFGRLCRHAAASIAAAVLIGAVSVPAASAGLVEKVTDTVGSTVKSVQSGATAVPLPSAPPPAQPSSPPPQVATPAPPPQAPPGLPSKELLPSKEPSASPSSDGAGSADPSVDEVAATARGAVDSVTRGGSEATTGAVTRERSDDGPTMTPQQGADRGASEAIVRRDRTASSSPPVAVRAAEVAALQRWLARVWPAIALGGSGGSGAGVVELIATDLFRPALAAVTGLLLASSPVLQTSGDAPLGGHQGVAGASRSAPTPTPVPAVGDGGGIAYLIAIAGLLALLAFTVWREFDVALRPWQHRP
jgi:hypothetical protein